MQALFSKTLYDDFMTTTVQKSHLKQLREATGMSQRELARQIGQDQSNIRYWESTGKPPRSDTLIPMAQALGVSVEELLGRPKPKRNGKPGGRLGEIIERVSVMPRRQRQRMVDMLETIVTGEEAKTAR